MGTELIKYSSDNIYANNYYNAYNEFIKARGKLVDYEQKTNDRESAKYQKLMSEFLFWNAKVPEISQIAGKEEEKINAKQQENSFASSPFYKNDKLDYMA